MPRILWFCPRSLATATNGGDLRTTGLIAAARALGHEVLLIAPTPAGIAGIESGVGIESFDGPLGVRLSTAKVFSRDPLRSPRLNRTERRRLVGAIDSFAPEVVVASEVMSRPLLRGLVPAYLPVVYDAQNDETRRFEELHAASTGVDRVTFRVDRGRVRRAERDLIARAAVIAAVSEQDALVFESRSTVPVEVVPSSVPLPEVQADPARADPVVLFVGSLDYGPNIAALVELVVEVLPRVAEQTALRLVVVGRRPAAAVRQLVDSAPWAELHADVPDLWPFYESARCTVLPIRSGGGTKLKVLEALSYGVPVVATPQAVAGIPLAPDEGVLIEADEEGIVAETVRLLGDPAWAGRCGANARRAFEKNLAVELSWPALARTLERALGSDGMT